MGTAARLRPRPAARRGVGLAVLGAALVAGACQLDELLRAPGSDAPSQLPGGGAAAVRLVFTVQPGTTASDAPFQPAVRVAAVDAGGTTVPSFAGTVTLTLAGNANGARLEGTTTRAAVQGVAEFPGVSVDDPGTGFRLAATGAGLEAATSAAFDVTRLPPDDLRIVSGNDQSDTVGATLRNPYVVRVIDGDGAPVAGIQVRWTAGAAGSVTPTASATDASGEASTVHTLGTAVGEYLVTASADGLPGHLVTFRSEARAGAATQLVFTQQPTDADRNETIQPPVRVTALDRFGNIATGFSATITMTITPGSGTPGGRLDGDRTRNPVGGVATFDDLRIRDAGLAYQLRATAPGGLLQDSAPFTVWLFTDDDDDDAAIGTLIPRPLDHHPAAGVAR